MSRSVGRRRPTASTRRRATTVVGAAAGLLCLAGPAVGAKAPAGAAVPAVSCVGDRPTASSSWRAFVPAGTPLRPRPGASGRGAPASAVDRWLLVLGHDRDADGRCLVRVRLPSRPNTARAWVALDRVRLRRTGWRIEVSRGRRTATVLHGGRTVGRWRVVVGAPATPTPVGTFAIVGSYRPPAGDFYGSWILSLTAHSNALERYDGGDGRAALHGRGGASLRDPLGSARSHGCVRLENRAISAIVRRIGRPRLPGVPVIIR